MITTNTLKVALLLVATSLLFGCSEEQNMITPDKADLKAEILTYIANNKGDVSFDQLVNNIEGLSSKYGETERLTQKEVEVILAKNPDKMKLHNSRVEVCDIVASEGILLSDGCYVIVHEWDNCGGYMSGCITNWWVCNGENDSVDIC